MIILLLSSLIGRLKSTYSKVPRIKVRRVGTLKLVFTIIKENTSLYPKAQQLFAVSA
jgi:hypothetical protein